MYVKIHRIPLRKLLVPPTHLYAQAYGQFTMSLADKSIIIVPHNHGKGRPVVFSGTIEHTIITEVGKTICMKVLSPKNWSLMVGEC